MIDGDGHGVEPLGTKYPDNTRHTMCLHHEPPGLIPVFPHQIDDTGNVVDRPACPIVEHYTGLIYAPLEQEAMHPVDVAERWRQRATMTAQDDARFREALRKYSGRDNRLRAVAQFDDRAARVCTLLVEVPADDDNPERRICARQVQGRETGVQGGHEQLPGGRETEHPKAANAGSNKPDCEAPTAQAQGE